MMICRIKRVTFRISIHCTEGCAWVGGWGEGWGWGGVGGLGCACVSVFCVRVCAIVIGFVFLIDLGSNWVNACCPS